MTLTASADHLSAAAKTRMESSEGGAFLLADWVDAVFIHYEVNSEVLQRQVPFALHQRDGKAYISLVAFTMRRMRLAMGGRYTEWATTPIATHGFLNLRTYVRHQDEPGIYFLAEWLPNALSVFGGPRTFGLPYRWGKLDCHHAPQDGHLHGRVSPVLDAGVLKYHAEIEKTALFAASEPDTLDEFLLERYTAFTMRHNVARRFRIWHEPWRQTPFDIRVTDTSLLEQTGPWFEHAKLIGACRSPGVTGVWIGNPHCINGPACLRTGMEKPQAKE